ncbi:MAG TPA: SDR family oxidoreductase [bacterium]|nr:SDR family oxidoreductase [bacterium]
MARNLVTGGAGFIGSNLARKLVSLGEEVVILDDFSTGKADNLDDIRNSVEVVRGSICDINTVRGAIRGVERVFHHAAVVSVVRSVDDPLSTNAVNIDGTLNCLVAAKEAGVKKFVFAASSSAYGDNPRLPKNEDMKPEPLSPYAISKLTGEFYARVFYKIYGLPTVSLRYFNIFGPHQDPKSLYAAVIPIFITKILKGESPVIYGDGEQSRDFTFIDNAVQANLLAAQSGDAAGRVINVACGTRYTLNQLVTKIRSLTQSAVVPTYAERRPGDVVHSQGDIALASKLLGYSPSVSFDQGLEATVRWFRQASSK